ncbi:Zinc finger, CW-type [Cynara cardunculus var. scolymus]|uniref:Zinc finger, CW-type n=1 Tax=Cynara cardunculus var. scolymus TaxID=59895 RepID=A0A118JWM2_CYNCS|nr:Zinc finger, CW-type [Cynara cardunculus var. scolymus]
MISVGSRDEREELRKMESETELEEGEACFQNNNDDDSAIDPDISLSYIDEKIQDVLGHCQKEFEGGVSAENLGAKFGGYGSFLPTYQRSPLWPHPKTPPKVLTYSAPISPNNAHVEVDHQNSVSQSSASQPARHGPTPRRPSMNSKLKQEAPTSSAMHGDKSTSNSQQTVKGFASGSDQKSLKVRIRVGSDNLSDRRNAEIYSGLGLDVSPSSSLEISPVDSDGFFHVPQDGPDESPTICGSRLLSPLPYDVLNLTEKKWEDGSCGPVHKGSQESTVTALHGSDLGKTEQNVLGEKPKSSETNTVSMESTNGIDVPNGTGILAKKETSVDNMVSEELVSNPRRLPLPSNDDFSDIAKEEDPVLPRYDQRVEQLNGNGGSVGEANNTTCDENNSGFPTKADSDVSSGSKTLDSGLVKTRKHKDGKKAPLREMDGMKLVSGNKTSSSGGKRKSKGQDLDNGSQNIDISKSGVKNDSFTSRGKNNANGSKIYTENLKKNSGKARETYKYFFGELDLEQEDPDEMALEKSSGGRVKETIVNEKGTLENNSLSKERLVVMKSQKPSSSLYPRVGSHVPVIGNGLGSDVAVASMAPVVNEDWVCCDKCEKWRLLPPGVNPGSLPEKWLCSMLDWLPGMNRCSISEEETYKAITSRFPGPSLVQGSQPPVHPGGPQLGVISLDASCPDGRNRHFGSEIPSTNIKKKHESKDLTNEVKQERPSLSSNSTKKNLDTSYRSRSLNGRNQSPRVNEAEFQDSGHSIKMDGIHGTDEDWTSDHGGTVFKASCSSSSGLPADISRNDRGKLDRRPKDTKSVSKVSAQDQENQNQTSSNDGTLHTGKSNKKDVAKKRKANEFEGTGKYVKEASETNSRKEKKSRVLKSGDEGTDEKRKNVEDASRRRDTVPVLSSLAATSSSSKVSGSHKTKPNNQEAKGSPVESVSSSPLRILNIDKFTSSRRNIRGNDDLQDAFGPKKCSDEDDQYLDVSTNKGKEKIVPFLEFETSHVAGGGVGTSGHCNRVETSSHGQNEERTKSNQSHSNGSRSRKHGKGSSLRSKEKSRSRIDIIDKGTSKISEPLNKNVDYRLKGGRKSDNLANGSASKELPSGGNSKHRHHDGSDVRIDAKQPMKRDVSGRGKSHSLPPSGKGQNGNERLPEANPGYQKESGGNPMLLDAARRNDSSKASKPNKKAQNQNGKQPMNTKHSTPNRHKGGNTDAPVTLVRDISNQATTNALREATNLKHMADRMKTGRYGDMIQSMSIYSSTAKLCEYCAHEYERTKEMATASLAYKCMEVAYLKVIYSSHTTASKDVNELQTSLQIGPTGESPSSSASASDLDNMNNPATIDKAALAKGLNAPQIAGNHDVNSAMEASRKARSCFAASSAKQEASLSAVKKALDFNFHDVEELLRLIELIESSGILSHKDRVFIDLLQSLGKKRSWVQIRAATCKYFRIKVDNGGSSALLVHRE